MDYDEFLEWLKKSKNLTNRSAKDVLSRCRRIEKMAKKNILEIEYHIFLQSQDFHNQSMFVKSQLKRAFSLFKEFKDNI